MSDYMNIGSSPCEEACAQLGEDGYHTRARAECNAYIGCIRRALGEEPFGARLAVKSFAHDFGSYLEVVCHYEETEEEAVNYAYRCESDSPKNWDAVALAELAELAITA